MEKNLQLKAALKVGYCLIPLRFLSLGEEDRRLYLQTLDKSSPLTGVPVAYATSISQPHLKVDDLKMGDHPVVWINEKMKARNVYFLMGHHSNLFQSDDFKKMFGNAVIWAAGR